ncbi:MAG: hypothetical protein VYB91_02915 [Pseudomonadota bacterium]|nr:hypothetical protein [Pseudomonadota bacterium]
MAKKCLFNLVFGWILVFGWLAGAGVSPALARDAYLSLAPDIPLAPGLSEFDGGQVVFDKPEGRIVRIEAERLETQGAGDGVPAFYRETLPNLGWQLNDVDNSADNVLTLQRGDETLLITMQGERVVFKLSPFAESDGQR